MATTAPAAGMPIVAGALLGGLLSRSHRGTLQSGGLPAQLADAARRNIAGASRDRPPHRGYSSVRLGPAAFAHGLDMVALTRTGVAAVGIVASILFLPRQETVPSESRHERDDELIHS